MSSSLARLLDLQELDVSIDQLQHRRTNLPQRAELKRLAADEIAAARAIQPVVDERAALARDEKRLEDDAATVNAKAISVDKRLYSGTVTSPRELQAIQEEIDSLKRRQRELEDHALELMVQIEPLDATIDAADEARRGRAAQVEAISDQLTVAEAEIDVELDDLAAKRAAVVGEFDASVISQYDALRKRLGGVAVARLEQGSCRGCHLRLSSVDFDRIKHEPPDVVVYCEQCGRILIR
jgi:predicted  nucleic acid-binding Zn-ribbon protein